MAQQSTKNHPSKLILILTCAIVAGGVGMILSLLVTRLGGSPMLSVAIPIIVAVPLALIGGYSWKKGFKNVGRDDYVTSIMAGVGATIGVILVLTFS